MAELSVPLAQVVLDQEVEDLVRDVLRSGQLAQGPRVAELEAIAAAAVGVRHAVAVSNGTTALVAALQAAGIGPGDEVVTVPFTFIATLNAILEVGASVVFADITHDFTMDPDSLSAVVGPRTRAVMPVHLYGLPADMTAIGAVAQSHGLQLIEDAAQALGARCDGVAAGAFGIGCFSLYATKNVTSGEGGLITTDDDTVADRLRLLRNQGMQARYDYRIAGHNYRLTDLQAAVAIPQLRRLSESTKRRMANATALTAGLAGLPGLTLPREPARREHVWHQYTVRVGPDARVRRDGLVRGLAERGVGAGVFYPRLVHEYPCYREDPRIRATPTPRAAAAAAEVVSLPVHPHLSDAQLTHVVDAVREVFDA